MKQLLMLGLFLPTVHVLNTQGGYDRMVLLGTEQGVSRVECEMRLEAWRQEHMAEFEVLIELMAQEGVHAAVRTSCERK